MTKRNNAVTPSPQQKVVESGTARRHEQQPLTSADGGFVMAKDHGVRTSSLR